MVEPASRLPDDVVDLTRVFLLLERTLLLRRDVKFSLELLTLLDRVALTGGCERRLDFAVVLGGKRGINVFRVLQEAGPVLNYLRLKLSGGDATVVPKIVLMYGILI